MRALAQSTRRSKRAPGSISPSLKLPTICLIGHLAEWPVGRYHKAHFHGGGAVLVILRSQGYSLMWPNHLGTQPYENGFGDQVVRVDWMPGSVFSPPTNWFHQHFNTGAGAGVAAGAALRQPEVSLSAFAWRPFAPAFTLRSNRAARLIEYDDEDPAIRRTYEASWRGKGIAPDSNYEAAANDD